MLRKSFHSVAEQVAHVLLDGVRQGRWRGKMPGRFRLAAELGVNHKTVHAAMQLLEKDGVLVSRGQGREREIVATGTGIRSGLQVRLLLYEPSDAYEENVLRFCHLLEERGHQVVRAVKTQRDLGFDVKRVSQLVEKNDGDAWIILAGSQPVLEWFAKRPVPAFAVSGRMADLPIASFATRKLPALCETLGRLVDLGHRNIVLLTGEERRKPAPGMLEKKFLKELDRLGIQTGNYNLPDWETSAQGFRHVLDSLFRHTPPTALLIDEPAFFFATQHYLLQKGLMVPRDVSLVVLDSHPAFTLCEPGVAHIRTDTRRWVPLVLQWVDHVAKGRDDRQQTVIRSQFVEGGTIGPVRTRN